MISEKTVLTKLLRIKIERIYLLIYLRATSQTFDKREVPAVPVIDKVTT